MTFMGNVHRMGPMINTIWIKRSARKPVTPAETKLYQRVVRGGIFASLATEISSAKRFLEQPRLKRIDPNFQKANAWFPEAPFFGLRLVATHWTLRTRKKLMPIYTKAQ